MLTIYKKDLHTYFSTLSGYIFIAAILLVGGIYVYMNNFSYGLAGFGESINSVPFFFVLAIIATTIMAAFGMWQGAALLWGAYGFANLAMTGFAIVQNGFKLIYLSLPVLFLLLHVSYGIGTLLGIIQLPFKLKWLRGQD